MTREERENAIRCLNCEDAISRQAAIDLVVANHRGIKWSKCGYVFAIMQRYKTVTTCYPKTQNNTLD